MAAERPREKLAARGSDIIQCGMIVGILSPTALCSHSSSATCLARHRFMGMARRVRAAQIRAR
jgi:hypothetical protein